MFGKQSLIQLDFNAIAQGYSVDLVLDLLLEAGRECHGGNWWRG